MNVYKKAGDQRDELKGILDSLSGSERATGGVEEVRRATGPEETAVRVDGQTVWMLDALRGAGWEEVSRDEWSSDRWRGARAEEI